MLPRIVFDKKSPSNRNSMDKIDVPWAQRRGSPGKKVNRLMLPSLDIVQKQG